jgi:ABC transport system ATP-binding/permease protein
MLARALATPSNLLVLDEPTNDLDLETLDLLQEMLTDYAGTVIVVSHDRDFLDRVCSSVLMSEDKGSWVEYAGGYSDMLNQRGAGVSARGNNQRRNDRKASELSAAEPKTTASGRKMTFKDRHALETLPDVIDAIGRDVAKLELVLSEPGLYARDRTRHQKATDMLAGLQQKRVSSEEEWFRLEALREEIEG